MSIFELARFGHFKELKDLLAKEPDKINVQDNIDGETALMIAAKFSNRTSSLETVKTLLEYGADPKVQKNDGYTALMRAAKYSNKFSSLETVKTLLEYGADPNVQDNYGWTALMLAARNSNNTSSLETVKTLLEAGADPNVQNICKQTAYTIYSNRECNYILSNHIPQLWKEIHNQIKTDSKAFSLFTPIDRNIWELILLRRQQQILCKNLSSSTNRPMLYEFAKTLKLNVTEETSKRELSVKISDQLAQGSWKL